MLEEAGILMREVTLNHWSEDKWQLLAAGSISGPH